MWHTFITFIEQGLLFFNQILETVGIPYSFGFAIILFTLTVKGLTFPLNLKQLKTSAAQQKLQPKLKKLQAQYHDDREGLAQAQMALYKEHGVNPLGGCLPTLIQMPIWLLLYRALFALANQPNSPLTEGFFWLPSLIGPVGLSGTVSRGIDWLIPNSDQFLGWHDASAYLVLPVILVISQLYSQRLLTPKSDDPQQKVMSQMMSFMPLMFGYFALVVPAGLSLYWFTSNMFSIAQQQFLLKRKNTTETAISEETDKTEQRTIEQAENEALDTSDQEAATAKPASRAAAKRKRRAKKRRHNKR